MNTGRRIYNSRIEKGISQMELAIITGINACQISNYETGKHVPKIENLKKIADALGVTTDYLYMIKRY